MHLRVVCAIECTKMRFLCSHGVVQGCVIRCDTAQPEIVASFRSVYVEYSADGGKKRKRNMSTPEWDDWPSWVWQNEEFKPRNALI